MRNQLLTLTGALLLQLLPATNANAGDVGVNVILAGELSPGVYGQVQLGNAPRPRMVYDYPVMVREERVYRYAEPVYLHVPPTYISNWSHHCGYYHACGRRVYFVRSAEYDNYYRDPHHHHYESRYRAEPKYRERHYDHREDRHDDHHDRKHDRRDDRHDDHRGRHRD